MSTSLHLPSSLLVFVLSVAGCSGATSPSPSVVGVDAGGDDGGSADAAVTRDAGVDAALDGGAYDAGLGVTCSGASPSFSKDVAPILQHSCAGGELCHSGTIANPWQYKGLVGAPSTRDCASAGVRVTASDLDKSYLVHKLTGVGMCPGSERMPRGGQPLPKAQIQTIADWICAGAKND